MKTIIDVKEQVDLNAQGNRDFTLQLQDLTMLRNGALNFSTEVLTPNEHALSQLSTRVGIPTRYAKKCMEENPEMIAPHFNYWISQEEHQKKGVFLRAKGDVARAVLSDRYSILDNTYVTSTLMNVFQSDPKHAHVKDFNEDPRFFNLRMVFPNLSVNLGSSQRRDDVFVGFHVSNSEVGSGALRIDSCLYRLVCSNGLMMRVGGKGNESFLSQRHVHLTHREMEGRFAEAITGAVKFGNVQVDNFAKLQDVKISDPLQEIRDLAKTEKYSQAVTDIAVESYLTEKAITGNDSAYEIVNAFTRTAQQLPTFEQRLDMELVSGKLMSRYL